MKKSFWSKWQTITGALVATCVLVGIVWAKAIRPEIKKEVLTCQVEFEKRLDEKLDRKFDRVIKSIEKVSEKITFLDTNLTPRVMKTEIGQWVSMSKKEKDITSEIYIIKGGK